MYCNVLPKPWEFSSKITPKNQMFNSCLCSLTRDSTDWENSGISSHCHTCISRQLFSVPVSVSFSLLSHFQYSLDTFISLSLLLWLFVILVSMALFTCTECEFLIFYILKWKIFLKWIELYVFFFFFFGALSKLSKFLFNFPEMSSSLL